MITKICAKNISIQDTIEKQKLWLIKYGKIKLLNNKYQFPEAIIFMEVKDENMSKMVDIEPLTNTMNSTPEFDEDVTFEDEFNWICNSTPDEWETDGAQLLENTKISEPLIQYIQHLFWDSQMQYW